MLLINGVYGKINFYLLNHFVKVKNASPLAKLCPCSYDSVVMKAATVTNSDFTESRLLSEAESSSLTGVTVETLRSYTQFSLLKPVIRNQKPFYRYNELTQLFNVEAKEEPEQRQSDQVPTLENLLNPNATDKEDVKKNASPSENNHSAHTVVDGNLSNNLPALRIEDVIFQNQALNSRLKSLEDERDWLRKRVEQLEDRSAREQMLMLKEKETLREVINVTLVKSSKSESLGLALVNYIRRIALPFFGTSEIKRQD